MDNLITQVERGETMGGTTGGGGTTSQQQRTTTTTHSPPIPPSPRPPPPRRRRSLSSLICCCWRKQRSGSKSKDEISPGGQTLPPSSSPYPQGTSIQSDHQVITGTSTSAPSSSHHPFPTPSSLLPTPLTPEEGLKIVMVIDLDETLVHSSFKPIDNPDFIVPVEIDGQVHSVYVLKRPYVDEFLIKMGQLYECVLFTASLSKYADPVADLLDQWGVFKTRLFREACVFHRGNYVKDLNKLGRDLKRIIIIDNSPASYIFHPDNAVPVASWFDDSSDTELLYLIPFFERLATVDNVYSVLRNSNHPFNLQSGVGGGSTGESGGSNLAVGGVKFNNKL